MLYTMHGTATDANESFLASDGFVVEFLVSMHIVYLSECMVSYPMSSNASAVVQ